MKLSQAQILERFQKKQAQNPRYTLRAYARDLGVSASLLSLVLARKRPPSANLSLKILAFEKSTETLHLPKSKPLRHRLDYANPQFLELPAPSELENWYEIALLDLLAMTGEGSDAQRLSRKLGITLKKVVEAIEKLESLKLIEVTKTRISKTNHKISIQTQHSQENIRKIHRGFLQRALEELDRTDPDSFSKRKISGTTIAANAKRIAVARKRVDHFQQELTDFLSVGSCTELYQLNVQLFPLSR